MEKNNSLIELPDKNIKMFQNEYVGICGPTGSGKTTLLNQIYTELCKKIDISYVFQESRLIETVTVEKNIQLVNKDCQKWLEKLDLLELSDRKAGFLSGGEAQRVNLARAFAWDGQLYLLDEPFSAQDENHKQLILELIRQVHLKGRTVVMVSHEVEVLNKHCDRVIDISKNT